MLGTTVENLPKAIRSFSDPSFTFAGEIAGPTADTFKEKLAERFTDFPSVRRAYLALTQYPERGNRCTVALVGDTDNGVHSILHHVSEISHTTFAPESEIDIMFIPEHMETSLKTVCSPFFQREN